MKPANGEREHLRRGLVEPLKVIHRHQQWPAGGQLAQQVQQAEGHRARSRWLTSGVGAQQRHLQPPALRRRQATQHHRFYPVQQVSQAGNDRLVSALFGLADSTRTPRPSAASRPACHSVVLPTPGLPLSTRAAPLAAPATNSPRTFELRLTPDNPRNAFLSRRMHHTPNLSPAASAVSSPAGNSSTERAVTGHPAGIADRGEDHCCHDRDQSRYRASPQQGRTGMYEHSCETSLVAHLMLQVRGLAVSTVIRVVAPTRTRVPAAGC